jgi:RHS repeat-associated protein
LLHYSDDVKDQLIQVGGTLGTCSTAAACYAYDAEGKRMQKTVGSVQTTYLYDVPGHVVAEDYGTGWGPGYVYAGGQLITEYENSTTFFVHDNNIGTSTILSNMAGGINPGDCNALYPYGEQDNSICSTSNLTTHKFTGKERDTESNLDSFGARYYSSAQGRFITADPKLIAVRHLLNPQKLNKYVYVLNDPLAMIDPNGQEEVSITFRAFIPQANVAGFRGDNRSFSSSSDARSRVSVTVRIETDPSKNGGHPMIGTQQTTVTPTHSNLTGGEKTSTGPLMPQVTATQGKDGTVSVNIQENMRNPYQPVFQGIASNVNINVNESATSASVQGTVSGAPSFEANFTTQSGATTNLPLQSAPQSTTGFIIGLQQTNQVDKKTDLKKDP